MFHNRISGFDMGLDDQHEYVSGQPQPLRVPRVLHAPQSVFEQVSVAAIYQAAINKVIQEYELNRLFNPEHYDYEI